MFLQNGLMLIQDGLGARIMNSQLKSPWFKSRCRQHLLPWRRSSVFVSFQKKTSTCLHHTHTHYTHFRGNRVVDHLGLCDIQIISLLKIIHINRDGFGKMHCKKLIIFVGSSPSQGDIFFLKSDLNWAFSYILIIRN